jgi:stress-induced morphogen
VTVEDTSDGCGSKFEAIIVSSKFDGVPLLERQQMVNGVIAAEMQTIHAFSMKTWTPEQYAKKRAAS